MTEFKIGDKVEFKKSNAKYIFYIVEKIIGDILFVRGGRRNNEEYIMHHSKFKPKKMVKK